MTTFHTLKFLVVTLVRNILNEHFYLPSCVADSFPVSEIILIWCNLKKGSFASSKLLLLFAHTSTCYILRFKSLGILIIGSLIFEPFTAASEDAELGFYFRNRCYFSFETNKALLLLLLCLCLIMVILFICMLPQCLNALDTVYHGALTFVTTCKVLSHRCYLYALIGWPTLCIFR